MTVKDARGNELLEIIDVPEKQAEKLYNPINHCLAVVKVERDILWDGSTGERIEKSLAAVKKTEKICGNVLTVNAGKTLVCGRPKFQAIMKYNMTSTNSTTSPRAAIAANRPFPSFSDRIMMEITSKVKTN